MRRVPPLIKLLKINASQETCRQCVSRQRRSRACIFDFFEGRARQRFFTKIYKRGKEQTDFKPPKY